MEACGNPDAILHDEDLQLSARKYIPSNTYRKGVPNLTTEMVCKWVSDSFSVEIIDGHDREDVVTYRKDLLEQVAKFDETTITPSTPSQSVIDGENKYIRIYHDVSTFYANADQTRFWNDGESQVLCQKSLAQVG